MAPISNTNIPVERYRPDQDEALKVCCLWGIHSLIDYQRVIDQLIAELEAKTAKFAEENPEEDEEDWKQETYEYEVLQEIIKTKQILEGRFPSRNKCVEVTRTARGGTRHNMPKKRCNNSTKRNKVTGKSAKKRCHNSTKRNRVTGKSAKKRYPTGTRRNKKTRKL